MLLFCFLSFQAEFPVDLSACTLSLFPPLSSFLSCLPHLFIHSWVSCVSLSSAGTLITTATRAQTPFTVICPGVQGDYVFLYWQPHGPRRPTNMSLLYHYDRWRGIAPVNAQSKRLQLAGSPYNAEAGSFSFLLTPELTSGGLYTCDVCLNDHFYSQRTLLSVFQGTDLCENVKQKCIISRVGWGFKQLHILDIDVVLQARAQMAQFSLHAICS